MDGDPWIPRLRKLVAGCRLKDVEPALHLRENHIGLTVSGEGFAEVERDPESQSIAGKADHPPSKCVKTCPKSRGVNIEIRALSKS